MIIASWNAIPYIKKRRSADPPQLKEHSHDGISEHPPRREDYTDNRAAFLILVSHWYSTDFMQNKLQPIVYIKHYKLILNILNGHSLD